MSLKFTDRPSRLKGGGKKTRGDGAGVPNDFDAKSMQKKAIRDLRLKRGGRASRSLW